MVLISVHHVFLQALDHFDVSIDGSKMKSRPAQLLHRLPGGKMEAVSFAFCQAGRCFGLVEVAAFSKRKPLWTQAASSAPNPTGLLITFCTRTWQLVNRLQWQ